MYRTEGGVTERPAGPETVSHFTQRRPSIGQLLRTLVVHPSADHLVSFTSRGVNTAGSGTEIPTPVNLVLLKDVGSSLLNTSPVPQLIPSSFSVLPSLDSVCTLRSTPNRFRRFPPTSRHLAGRLFGTRYVRTSEWRKAY